MKTKTTFALAAAIAIGSASAALAQANDAQLFSGSEYYWDSAVVQQNGSLNPHMAPQAYAMLIEGRQVGVQEFHVTQNTQYPWASDRDVITFENRLTIFGGANAD